MQHFVLVKDGSTEDTESHGYWLINVLGADVEPLLLASQNSARSYLINGKAPQPGQRFFNKDLARTYKKIAEHGVESFYEGELCDAIVRCSDQNNGLLSQRDFKDHTTTWVEPLSTNYRGYTVYELPPNGQGLIALEMLNILEGYDLSALGHNSPEHLHFFIEAKKAAFSDRDTYVTDPEFAKIPVDELLSKDYSRMIRDRIDPNQAKPVPSPFFYRTNAETVYVTAVDQERNAVSLISSIFMHFGSGMVVDGTGILLQNRGKAFSLNPKHFNRLEPHKRPVHTIIPAMVFKDGQFLMSFGVMGADMQPQGHVQFLANIIDFKMNLQEAVDAPRARHVEGMEVYVEDGISEGTASALEAKGHRLRRKSEPVNQAGGGQAIYFDRDQDVLLGASDRRKDGCSIGY